jgi:hypothetical protein
MGNGKGSAVVTGEKIFTGFNTNNFSDDHVSNLTRFFLILFVLWVGLSSIAGNTFSLHDESRVAGIAWEMAVENDYIVPRLNGTPFLEYPPLGYIPIALFLKLTGIKSPFMAHLANAAVGMGTVFLIFLLGKTLGDEKTGILAAFFLQATCGFISLNASLRVDASLLFWITLSLYGFAAGYGAKEKAFRYLVFFYLGMAGAFLTKGLIGAGLPAMIAGIFILMKKDFSFILKMRPWWGVFIFAAPVLGWFFLLYQAQGPELAHEVWRQSVSRFFSASADHANPPYYYLRPILYLALPWTFFLMVIFWQGIRRRSRFEKPEGKRPANMLLPQIWFMTVFIVLSAASAKRIVYLGPIYPSIALMTALWWRRITTTDGFQRLETLFLRFFSGFGGILLAASVVCAFIAGHFILGAGLIGLVLLSGAFFVFFIQKLVTRKHAMAFFFCCHAIFVCVLHYSVILPDTSSESLQPFFTEMQPEWERKNIILYCLPETARGAAYFHFSRRMPMVWSQEDLNRKISTDPDLLVLTYDTDPTELNASLYPRKLKILHQRKLKSHHLSLLSVVRS